MNRETQINYPNGGRTTYTYDDTTPKTTKEVLVDASNNVGPVNTTFDKLYRVIKTETMTNPRTTSYDRDHEHCPYH